jgi:hypothetical protein
MAFEQSASILDDPTGIADNYGVSDLQPKIEVPTSGEYTPPAATTPVDPTGIADNYGVSDLKPKIEVPTTGKKSLLGRVGDKLTDPSSYIDPVVEGVTQIPAAALTQYGLNAIMGTPDYDTSSYGSYAAPFQSQDYGAVAQGLTPMANDGYQDMMVAYDALGQQSGGYGGLYRQRLGAFA